MIPNAVGKLGDYWTYRWYNSFSFGKRTKLCIFFFTGNTNSYSIRNSSCLFPSRVSTIFAKTLLVDPNNNQTRLYIPKIPVECKQFYMEIAGTFTRNYKQNCFWFSIKSPATLRQKNYLHLRQASFKPACKLYENLRTF